MTVKDPARSYFAGEMTDRERAIFEGGVGLASIYHQFVGIPISKDKKNIKKLEEAIRNSTLTQPYKKDVTVKIHISEDYSKKNAYDYRSLEGRDLDVTLITAYGDSKAVSRMRYVPELDYVLIYVEKIETID